MAEASDCIIEFSQLTLVKHEFYTKDEIDNADLETGERIIPKWWNNKNRFIQIFNLFWPILS